ncbi:E3 ubiquitin-protein ligase ptr1 [Nosema granulosis]|uniref:HECT-type E3 ubiquitin transferase n=1 Tax=Nosema granulosis TaxID=83296 RepID=A0A9P6H1Q4_9MICR|nr:E3 ubiquitin-protein ligase ptr1 [Nosema granulosis]
MLEKNKNIYLWSFKEYEAFFLEEENDMKLCISSCAYFDNWPFKMKKIRYWVKINKKIAKLIEKYYNEYFENGFQRKEFDLGDKIIICILFNILQRIYNFSDDPGAFKGIDKMLKFALCFDKDVMLCAFKTIYIIGEVSNISKTCSIQQEILYKIADLDVTLSDILPHIKDKVHKPIENIVIKDCVFAAFREYSKDHRESDVYIALIQQLFADNRNIFTVMKQNAIMILFHNLDADEYYHRLSSTYSLLDLEADRDYIKSLDINELYKSSRNEFMEILNKEDLFLGIEEVCSVDNKLAERLLRNVNFIQNVDVELKLSFERYLIFCLGYSYNFVHLIFILELNKTDGVFYASLKNALDKPELDKVCVFTLLELLIRTENQNVLDIAFVQKLMSDFLNADNNDSLQVFMQICYIFLKENEDFYLELLKGDFVEKCYNFVKKSKVEFKKEIIITILDMLFYLYKKQNTRLEPFEESKFLDVCTDLISQYNNELSTKSLKIITFFINSDPLCIEILVRSGICKVLYGLEGRKQISEDLGVSLINFIDALSLNIEFSRILREQKVFSTLLNSLNLYDHLNPISPENSLVDSISIFLRHHPEYNEEYAVYFIGKLKGMIELYHDRTPEDSEIVNIERFLDSFRHFKTNLSSKLLKKYLDEMVVLFVEFYYRVCVLQETSKNTIFNIIQMFVTIFGLLGSERKAIECILPKIRDVIRDLKSVSTSKNLFISIMEGEKSISLVSGIINNFFDVKINDYGLFVEIFELAMDLFTLTVDEIGDVFDREVLERTLISSYLCFFSRLKNENTEKDNIKIYSMLICLNFVFLLKFTIEEFDLVKMHCSGTFLDKFLLQITKAIEQNKDVHEEEKVKRSRKNNTDSKLRLYFEVLKHITDIFNSEMLHVFILWIRKHEMFIGEDSYINDCVLEVLSKIPPPSYIDKKYKTVLLTFLNSFKESKNTQRAQILKTISNIFLTDKDLDSNTEKHLSAIVSRNYYVGCKNRFKFLMKNTEFVIENIVKKNFGVFVDNITEETLDYIAFLINYHYDPICMFDLLKGALEVLTFVKKRADRGKLLAFVKKLKENGVYKEEYDFENPLTDISDTKIADKKGNLHIDEKLILSTFNEMVLKAERDLFNIPWTFFLGCGKYYEARLNKFDLLADIHMFYLCLLRGYQNQQCSMLILHFIFANQQDLYNLKDEIINKRDLLNFYGLNNDEHDFFPLIYRNPNLIFLKEMPEEENVLKTNDAHNSIVTSPVLFWLLMNESAHDKNALYILSEIVYNYPRYISFIDLVYIRRIVNNYLDNDFAYIKDPEEQGGAKRALEFLSICFHTLNPNFLGHFIEFTKETLTRKHISEICGIIFILCNVSNPLVTLNSVLEQKERGKNIHLGFKELLKKGVLDLFIEVISDLNEKELPNLRELSNNSETLINDLGIKNLNMFLVQNRFDYLNTYEVSEFNLNTFSDLNKYSDQLLSVAFNFVYNIYYSTYQKEIEDSGILDVEMSDEEIEHDFDSNETFYNEEDESGTEQASSSTIYNDTQDEEIEESEEENKDTEVPESQEKETVPMVRSIYLRLETEFKTLDEDNKKLIFENISKNIKMLENVSLEANEAENESMEEEDLEESNDLENEDLEESNDLEDEDLEDESSIGVADGWIPDIIPEELAYMNEFELEEYVSGLTEERKANFLEYKAIDKEFLNNLMPRFRRVFESYEELLKDFYSPEVDVFYDEKDRTKEKIQSEINVYLKEENVCGLLENFIRGKYSCKPQIYNIFKILSLCKKTRKAIFERSIKRLLISACELNLETVDQSEKFESIRKCIEMIRLVTSKHKIEGFENEKTCLVRCLFALLGYKEVAMKSLYLLNLIDFDSEIFDETVKSGSELFEETNEMLEKAYFVRNTAFVELRILADLMKVAEMWINKKTTGYLKNIISKMNRRPLGNLIFYVMDAISVEFRNILECEDSLILQKYVESQNKISNLVLIFNFCFTALFAQLKAVHKEDLETFFYNIGMEYKGLEKMDLKYLCKTIPTVDFIKEEGVVIEEYLVDMFYSLITKGIESVLRKMSKQGSSKIDSYYLSGLYNVYFLVFSVYEGVLNFFILFKPPGVPQSRIDEILLKYDGLRNGLTTFLDSNIAEINSIFSTETDVFSQNIEFLSRFNVINFVNKNNYFRGKIQELNPYKEGSYTINVRRKQILSDSLFQIMNKTSKEFKTKKLQIKFAGEEGLDFGGLTREWFGLLVKDITNPDLGLFIYTSEKKTTVLPYRNSKINSEHLLYFRFVGRILAKSILDRTILDLHIDKSAYRYFLGKKCELGDLEPIDPQFYNSLIWIRDNPIENVVCLTFSTEYTEFGDTQIVDLKPNGRNIPVTDENKQEYIDLIVEYKLFKGIEIQLNSIKQGLFEIIDRDLLLIFNENEFELLISGIPEINVDDWMNNTDYYGYKSNSPNIIWFWKAVRSFTPEERAKLLQFCTGSSRVPFEGFSHLQGNSGLQKFSIHKSSSDNVRLPSAHTCFNQLDLPEYPSFADLRKSVLYAINECTEGFGLI